MSLPKNSAIAPITFYPRFMFSHSKSASLHIAMSSFLLIIHHSLFWCAILCILQVCIGRDLICDKHCDCEFCDDEDLCREHTYPCLEDTQFRCDDGYCIAQEKVCNGMPVRTLELSCKRTTVLAVNVIISFSFHLFISPCTEKNDQSAKLKVLNPLP